MEKADIKVSSKNINQLREYFEQQVLAIPDLQRNFVWTKDRIRDLADSIYKGYAIGSFTVWDAPRKREGRFKHHMAVLPPYKSDVNDRIHYVIDGQQRLSAIYSLLKSGGAIITNDWEQEINSFNICFALKPSEDGLNFVYIKSGPDSKKYFSLCEILGTDFDRKFSHLKKKRKKVYERLLDCRERFLNYAFCFVYVGSDIQENNFRETFIRLNTRGMRLSAVDRAYAYASRVGLREYVRRIKDRLGVLKAVDDKPIHEVLFVVQRADEGAKLNSKAIDTYFKQLNTDKAKEERFKKGWKKIANSVEYAEHFFKGKGVLSLDFLPSKSMIAVLATFYYFNNGERPTAGQSAALNRWFWFASLSNRYSGRGYASNLSKDCGTMKALALGRKAEFEGFDRKVDAAALADAKYYASRSSIASAFFCLLAKQQPLEFLAGGNPTIDLHTPTYREHKHNHHIFPQNLMDGLKVPASKYNSILNICFLPQRTNSKFSDAPPYKYLDGMDVDTKNLRRILESHLIPLDVRKKSSNIKAQFSAFTEERRNILMNKFEAEAGFKFFSRE